MSAIPTYPVAPSLRRVWHACYQNFCSPQMNPSGFINPADQSDVVCLKGGLVVMQVRPQDFIPSNTNLSHCVPSPG
ncbi:hypothetical protein FOZG_00667 [Fusarium oxysporum Fo47]|uniref:Uncharacterized protein n=1 Tax=Fusarium oxysporum Fo47 TaxID=660027 RepID=W9L9M2_FUSOX|nr:hypothetical protein FOZG_00667 [Fusarium oxysporum Fo47]